MPLPSDAHIDRYLTDFYFAWLQSQNEFVAGSVFPIVPVNKQSDKYLIYPKDAFWRDEMKPRPMGGKSERISYETSSDSYHCEEESVAYAIDDRLRANADDPLDPDRDGALLLAHQRLIHLDRIWATKYFQASVWSTNLTGKASAPGANEFLQWDQSGSTPIQNIRAWIRAAQKLTGRRLNSLVVGPDAYDVLLDHDDIVDRIKHTQTGITDAQILAALFGIDRVVVPGGINVTSEEGDTTTVDWILNSKAALLCFTAPRATMGTPTAGAMFAWTGLLPGAGANGGVIERTRDEQAHSDVLELRVAYDMKLVAADLGVFAAACVG